MLRVADEVRIFPLMTLNNIYSPHLDKVREALSERGYESEIIKTEYEFQQGGDEMLKVSLCNSCYDKMVMNFPDVKY